MWDAAGPVAQAIANQALALIAAASLLLALVLGVLARSLTRRGGGGTAWIAAGGLLLPALVLLPLAADSVSRSARVDRASPQSLLVTVTAHMWWWELRYADPAGGEDVVTANELHIPVGRPVRLALASEDVIHSLWVPQLAGKMDLVPGRILHLQVQAARAGRFAGRCAEFCGEAHARMGLVVVAEPPEAFERWLARQRSKAPIDAALAARGEQAFRRHGCVACHRVQGVSDARFGPDLSHVGARLALGAGRLSSGADSEAALRLWITSVQALKPGARMPSYAHLDDESLDALAAWLAAHR